MIKEINLLPWRLQAYEQKKRQLVWTILAAITVGFVATMLVHFFLQLVIAHYENKYELQQQQLISFNQRLKDIAQIQQQQRNYIRQIKQLKAWQAQKNWFPQFMNDMTKYLPDGIYLVQLKREDNSISFNGKAENNAEITHFMQIINRMNTLQSPSLKQIQAQAIIGFYDQNFIVQAFIKYPNEYK